MSDKKLLMAENITKNFGGLRALNNLNIRINREEILGLIGPNGAGKTTLFNVIAGRYPPDAGRVIFKDEKISGLPAYQVCKKGIARTFQVPRPLKEMSVLDNVIVGGFNHTNRIENARKKAEEAIAFMDLHDKKRFLAKNLSLVELKRLELAKTLVTDPALLLIDEPAAGLAAIEIEDLIELIQRIRKRGITIFMIEHVMGAIMRLAERIVVIHEGSRVAEGTPEEIQHNKRVTEVYLGTSEE